MTQTYIRTAMQTYRQSETGIQTDKDIERNTYVSNDRIPLYIHDASIHLSVQSSIPTLLSSSTHPSVHLSVFLPCQLIHYPINSSIDSPICQSILPSIPSSIAYILRYTSVLPTVCPFRQSTRRPIHKFFQ